MSNAVLKLKKVTKLFGGKGDVPSVEIFKGMDFTIKKNEVVGLFSPSGSGKTTFLQIAGLLDSKFSGEININGLRVNTKNDIQKYPVAGGDLGASSNSTQHEACGCAYERARSQLLIAPACMHVPCV